MSAGNLALIACVPGLGLMLLAVEASQKKSKGPGSDFIRMIESMGITRSSSNCESSEWGCSSTSKQPTLQHDHHTAGMGNTEAVPSVPGDMDRPCAHSPVQLSGTTGHKTRPVPAPKCWQLQPGCPAMPGESPVPSPRLLVLGQAGSWGHAVCRG